MGSAAGAQKAAATRIGMSLEDYSAQISAGLKWCSACKNWVAVGDFDADRSRGSGLSAKCFRCRSKATADRPGVRERRIKLAAGVKWCCGCKAWLPKADVKGGKCRAHHAELARKRYASDERYRTERQQHAHARRSGVAPIPVEGVEYRMEDFGGECAYCPNPATGFDHIIAVVNGGTTCAYNILACCHSCNSSKGDRDVIDWLQRNGKPDTVQKLEMILFLLEAQGYEF